DWAVMSDNHGWYLMNQDGFNACIWELPEDRPSLRDALPLLGCDPQAAMERARAYADAARDAMPAEDGDAVESIEVGLGAGQIAVRCEPPDSGRDAEERPWHRVRAAISCRSLAEQGQALYNWRVAQAGKEPVAL